VSLWSAVIEAGQRRSSRSFAPRGGVSCSEAEFINADVPAQGRMTVRALVDKDGRAFGRLEV